MAARLDLPEWIDAADLRIDQAWERLRGRPVLDAVFYAASAAGDFSIVWHALNLANVRAGRADRTELVRVAAAIGLESLIVNQGVKRIFARVRPEVAAGARPHRLRQPATSSFPSGHASSAVLAAGLLSDRNPRAAALYGALATVVALSRLHVRIHHFSDIVAGAALGRGLLAGFRRVWPR